MSEISRSEAIENLKKCDVTFDMEFKTEMAWSCVKAISDMQKLEKIEQIINDIADYEHEDFEYDIRIIEQIVKEGKE